MIPRTGWDTLSHSFQWYLGWFGSPWHLSLRPQLGTRVPEHFDDKLQAAIHSIGDKKLWIMGLTGREAMTPQHTLKTARVATIKISCTSIPSAWARPSEILTFVLKKLPVPSESHMWQRGAFIKVHFQSPPFSQQDVLNCSIIKVSCILFHVNFALHLAKFITLLGLYVCLHCSCNLSLDFLCILISYKMLYWTHIKNI